MEREAIQERRRISLGDCLLTSQRHGGLLDLERSLQAIQAWQPGVGLTRSCTAPSTPSATTIVNTISASPTRNSRIRRSLRSYKECVDALSCIFEVSENFDHSKEASTNSNISSTTGGSIHSMISSMKRDGRVPVANFRSKCAKFHAKKTRSQLCRRLKERILCFVHGLVRCYVSCMLYAADHVHGQDVDLAPMDKRLSLEVRQE